MKLPSFQFYPGDWQKDPGLRRCSHAAKGVLMDLLCLMFECVPRGVLISGTQVWSINEAALAVGGDQIETIASISELLAKDVLRQRSDNAIFSVRMCRDEQNRQDMRQRQQKCRASRHPGHAVVTAYPAEELGTAGTGANAPSCHAVVMEQAEVGTEGSISAEALTCHASVTPSVTHRSQASSSSSSSSDNNPHKPPWGAEALRIYEIYPLKVAKPKALHAIRKALTKFGFEHVFAKTEAFAKARNGDKAFMPHPTTWFTQERFNDAPETWVSAATTAPPKAAFNIAECL